MSNFTVTQLNLENVMLFLSDESSLNLKTILNYRVNSVLHLRIKKEHSFLRIPH